MDYEPVLPLISILSTSPEQMKASIKELTGTWDNIVVSSPPFLFNQSDFYEDEFGSPLYRWWAYRDTLANPGRLADWKNTCADIEQQLSDSQGNRTANIDPGYLNFGLVVLASFKYDLQKIYLGNKVYADPALQFGEGQFQPFPWSFPDFKQPDYYERLKKFRNRYKRMRKN